MTRPPETIDRHKTALHRTDLSRPVRLALRDQIICEGVSVFDYGCGRGGDVTRLRDQGFDCRGWDPRFQASAPKVEADVVNLGYVVNVIEKLAERQEALRSAWALARRCLVVAARLDADVRGLEGEEFEDGCLTQLKTFQKFYEQSELRDWIEKTLGVPGVPAAPGVFYVFRDDGERQAFLASRYRRREATPRLRRSDVLFETYAPLFEALMEFLAWRGRLPTLGELPEAAVLIDKVGSLKRAFRVIQTVTCESEWERIADDRAQDLLVHLALGRFDRRPTMTQLEPGLQQDVKAFFRSYKRACELADLILYSAGDTALVEQAIRNSPIGKATPTALYVHTSALGQLSPILRVYEGCARTYLGDVEGANVIKLFRGQPQVSYLTYPTFDIDPHPALAESLTLPLQTFRGKYRDYRGSPNPPILHRKEDFVAPDYPGREAWVALTAEEEKRGLYSDTSRIGTRKGWEEVGG